jgi:ribosomal protein L21E
MQRMRQALVLTLAALLLAAPATAGHKPKPPKSVTHSGTLVARSASSVTVKRGQRTVTCSRANSSPKVGTVRVGGKVTIACSNGVLVAFKTVLSGSAAGAISALSPTSLTVHTDGGDVTCTLNDGSPRVGDFHVGDRVKIACTDGVLTAVAKLEPPAEVQTGFGTLAALTDLSLTVQTERGDLTCTLNDRSPRLGDFHVGDKVKVACTNGVLTAIAKVVVTSITTGVLTAATDTSVTVLSDGGERRCRRTNESPSLDGYRVGDKVKMTCTNGVLTAIAKADTYQSGTGTLAALSGSSLTVHTETGDLTCRLGDGSPNVSEFHVGDKVKASCTNGALTAIARADSYQGGLGAITALSESSLTVHTDGGDLTCTLDDASPKVGDFRVGDKVKVYCKNGALISIAKVTTDVVVTRQGTLTVLSDTSLTVHNGDGDLTCKRGDGSPGLGDFHVGDLVKMSCTNGVLTTIARVL